LGTCPLNQQHTRRTRAARIPPLPPPPATGTTGPTYRAGLIHRTYSPRTPHTTLTPHRTHRRAQHLAGHDLPTPPSYRWRSPQRRTLPDGFGRLSPHTFSGSPDTRRAVSATVASWSQRLSPVSKHFNIGFPQAHSRRAVDGARRITLSFISRRRHAYPTRTLLRSYGGKTPRTRHIYGYICKGGLYPNRCHRRAWRR